MAAPSPSLILALLAFPLATTGCVPKRSISGTVIDRNGKPMDRVIVSLDPGDVELVTDSQGNFTIDYLRDANGERIKLEKKTDYSLEAFRTGFHVEHKDFFFKRGALVLEPLTLKEDTIRQEPSQDNIDPARFPDRTSSSGTNYEGE